MREKLTVGAGVLVLSFFGFVAAAGADSIRAEKGGVHLLSDVVGSEAGRDHVQALQADQAKLRMGDDLDRWYRQMMGNGHRETAKPFRPEPGDSKGSSAAPVTAPPPATVPLPAPPSLVNLVSPPSAPLAALEPVAALADPSALALGPRELELGAVSAFAANSPVATPEPASLLLLGSGLLGAGVLKLRRRAKPLVTKEL